MMCKSITESNINSIANAYNSKYVKSTHVTLYSVCHSAGNKVYNKHTKKKLLLGLLIKHQKILCQKLSIFILEYCKKVFGKPR